jgi:hypothetical protein
MDETGLTKLSAEQTAALNDEQKAIFCALGESDQDFYAETFKPADLPTVLARKGEIMQRSQAERERLQKLKAFMARVSEAHPPQNDNVERALTGLAMGALGIGGVAAGITDNNAQYKGVKPEELIAPLRAEFGGGRTRIDFSGRPEAIIATVALLSGSGAVQALTINLTSVNDGVEVKVNDLTTRGLIETVKEGGKALLELAEQGLDLLNLGKYGGSPQDVISTAQQTLAEGGDLAETASGLQLKERAWKAMKAAAESIEANSLSRMKAEREAREALEGAWDRFTNCPSCGVSFGPEDSVCRVCATARPEMPQKADPRQL